MTLPSGTPWAGAEATPLVQDASSRRYTRLVKDGKTAILMDDPDGDIPRFVRLARHLADLGLSAPRILAEADGQLLIEDLGEGLFARLAGADPALEPLLYQVATDALLAVQAGPVPAGLTQGTPAHMADLAMLGLEWYAAPTGRAAIDDARAAFEAALAAHAPEADVLILRDYHAENLLWLPERDGAARAGLLDFQDAMAGHRVYDLVSLLQDARRDVRPETVAATCRYFLAQTGRSGAAFDAAYAVTGAQRQLRILGIFVRLARLRGKPHYLTLLPRVYAHWQSCLRHPALAGVAQVCSAHLPEPTAAYLQDLSRR
jgi:aminoglycoside/choline kinase family phosphotransferase